MLDWGGMAEEAVADAIHVNPHPGRGRGGGRGGDADLLSHRVAALIWHGRVGAGDTVLIQGAAGASASRR